MSSGKDIPAYEMLVEEIKTLAELPTPPDDLTDMNEYKNDINQKFQNAAKTVEKVKVYADEVMKKLLEIRNSLKNYSTVVAKAIQEALEKLRENAAANHSPGNASSGSKRGTPAPYEQGLANLGRQMGGGGGKTGTARRSKQKDKNLEALERAHALEQLAKDLENNRLGELTKETEKYIAKLQDGASLTEADIQDLNGHCKAFVEKTKHSFEEQKQYEEAENKRKEKEEADKLIREEHERMRKENEKKEKKEKEEKEKAEAELRRRTDPSYWPYFRYDCKTEGNNDTEWGSKTGVCIFSSSGEKFEKDDLQCTMSDLQSLKNDSEPGETLASKLFCLRPKSGRLTFEFDARAYITHIANVDKVNEACVKISVNSGGWKTYRALPRTENIILKDDSWQFAGVKLNDFYEARMLVVVRNRRNHQNVGKEGGKIRSETNKKILLQVPMNTFDDETEVSMSTIENSSDTVDSINSSLRENNRSKVSSANHVIVIYANRTTNSNLQVTLPVNRRENDPDNPIYRLVSSSQPNDWSVASIQRGSDSISVSLPSGSDSYRVVEVSMSKFYTSDDAIKAADTVYDHANRLAVVMLFHQLDSDHKRARIQCVPQSRVRDAVKKMTQDGYTYGCQTSKLFHLRDGQELHFFFSGNIARDSNEEGLLKMIFFRNLRHTIQDVNLAVVNDFQQTGLPEYRGTLTCHIMEPGEIQSAERRTEYTVTLTTSLPKPEIVEDGEALPCYMKSLAVFLASQLAKSTRVGWRELVTSITGDHLFKSLNRSAVDMPGDAAKCSYILYEWMKESIDVLQVDDDGISPPEQIIRVIIGMLSQHGLHKIERQCESFVQTMKEQLSDNNLMKLASEWKGNIETAGQKLGFSKDGVQKCLKGVANEPRHQLFVLLNEWLLSDRASAAGTGVIAVLRSDLGI